MWDQALTSLLQGTLEDHMHRQHVAGAVVAITCQHSGPVVLAAGCEDLHGTEPMRVESRFPMWSISKTFLAVVVLRLAQRKMLTLEDWLDRWLPEVEIARSVTIRQLLNHTSGLPDYGVLPLYARAIREGHAPWSFRQFIAHTCTNDAVSNPGEGWRYSNIGYMVLCRIIEVATGQSLAAVMQSEITGPLQLTETAVVQFPEDLKSWTPGYSRFLDPSSAATDVREWYHPGWVAHSFLASTAAEVCRFLHSLFAGQLLDAGHLTQMLRLVPVPDHSPTEPVGYGLGIAGETDPTFGSHFGHEGAGPGYHAIVSHVPVLCDRSMTIAVLCNGDECQPRIISDALLHVLFWYFHEQHTVETLTQDGLSLA